MNEKFKKQTITTLLLILILSTTLVTACSAPEAPALTVPDGAQAGDLVNLEPCTYEAKDVEYAADCGTLIVPENRSDPNSRLIALPITRVRATGTAPTEPIFDLPGGPGIPNRGNGRISLSWFIDQHDVVIVGYCGVDGSVRLECPEVSAHIKNLPGDMLGEASIENMTDAYARCAERLQNEGVDLDGYTVVEVIDDLEDARLALGYGKINLWTSIFPFFAEPKGYDASALMAPELRAQWVGAWGLLGLFFVSQLFNTFLGEEFIFHGVLLPKMEGVFGKWDWVANGIIFSLYHLHQPWGILANIPANLVFAYSGKRFRSNWFPIILHSGQSVIFLFLILGLVLGLA